MLTVILGSVSHVLQLIYVLKPNPTELVSFCVLPFQPKPSYSFHLSPLWHQEYNHLRQEAWKISKTIRDLQTWRAFKNFDSFWHFAIIIMCCDNHLNTVYQMFPPSLVNNGIVYSVKNSYLGTVKSQLFPVQIV